MGKKDFLKYCKYYKGEDKDPFEGGTTDSMWWYGEMLLSITAEKYEPFLDKLVDELKKDIEENHVIGALLDESVSIEQRAIHNRLIAWHSVKFPYGSVDDIYTY